MACPAWSCVLLASASTGVAAESTSVESAGTDAGVEAQTGIHTTQSGVATQSEVAAQTEIARQPGVNRVDRCDGRRLHRRDHRWRWRDRLRHGEDRRWLRYEDRIRHYRR